MRTGVVLAALLVAGFSGGAPAGESVTMPWEEFKRLYGESVRREIMQALPARVDFLSVEGDLSPAAGEAWPLPAEVAGKRYFFSRSFYKGEALKAGLFYKEPVDPDKAERR